MIYAEGEIADRLRLPEDRVRRRDSAGRARRDPEGPCRREPQAQACESDLAIERGTNPMSISAGT